LTNTSTLYNYGGTLSMPPISKEDATRWHADMMKRVRVEGFFTERVMVTPAMAKLLLEHNQNNRSVKRAQLRALRRDIETNRWSFNSETVKVDDQGKLIDGQHRMHAIVEADRPADILIAWGLQNQSRMTVDMNTPRTVGDFIDMRNGASSSSDAAAACAGRLMAWETHNTLRWPLRERPSKQEILNYYADHQQEIDKALDVIKTPTLRFLGGGGLRSFMFAACARQNRPKAEEFFELLTGTVGLDRMHGKHPVVVARNKFLLSSTLGEKAQDRVEVIFRAWNYFIDGTEVSYLKVVNEWPKLKGQ
jgi:hypothetical protein